MAPSPRQDQRDGEEVGYCRPPRRHQFKKGQSGNPWGRPRKDWPTRPSLMRALMEPVVIRSNDKSRTVPRAEALVHVAMEKALQGDPKAVQILLGIMEKCGLFHAANDYPNQESAKARLEAKLQQMHERLMATDALAARDRGESGGRE